MQEDGKAHTRDVESQGQDGQDVESQGQDGQDGEEHIPLMHKDLSL